MKKAFVVIYLAASLLLLPPQARPFETDQFNLPKQPLADVGVEVSEYVAKVLAVTVDELNSKIVNLEKCRESRVDGCPKPGDINEKLSELRNPEALAKAFYEKIAGGHLMTTKFGKWMNSHGFRSEPARYKADYSESIYVLNPFNYATLSPTVRLYGHEFGIDKLEHLFQQGYQYYRIYNEAIKRGSTTEEATQKAIKWGQKTERTYYGLLTSGVYSNADLFANFAGFRFYQGISSGAGTDGVIHKPLVVLSKGLFVFDGRADLLKPFVADHMNEALNPSSYRITLVRSVRRSVGESCNDWKKSFPSLTAEEIVTKVRELNVWNGEDYGFSTRGGTIELAKICY